jgi:hypothetical protein
MEFSANVSGEREKLLLDAAAKIDALAGHLGSESADAGGGGSEYGDLLRGLAEDTAEFGAYPDIYPIPVLDLPNADHTSAAWKAALEDGFTFSWVRIPLVLFPRRNWAFNRLEVRIEFNPREQDPQLRPKAFDILPNRRFDTVMKVGTEVTIRVGADAHFALATGDIALDIGGASASVGAGVKTKGSIGAELGFAPMPYRAVAARVNHTDEGLERVFWRLDGGEFFRESSPQLIVIVQVPRGCTNPEMLGVMQAYRRFNLFPAGLQAAIRQLPEAFRVFFSQGAPIRATARYELTPIAGH